MSRFLLIGATTALALVLVAAPAVSAAPGERLGRAAEAAVEAGVPGIAVLVRDKGRTTVVTRGYDDLEAKRPMSVADRFPDRQRHKDVRGDDRPAAGGRGQALA